MIKFYNKYHLGDCLHHLDYCNKLKRLYPDETIEFYVNKNYIKELEVWNEGILLKELESKPADAVNSWINVNNFNDDYTKINKNFDEMYIRFYEMLSSIINLKNPIDSSYKFLFDNKKLADDVLTDEKKYDFLIINSGGLSGQVKNEQVQIFDKFIANLIKLNIYKIITTAYNKNFKAECTLDYNFNLLQIGQLSKKCENIIGIHTSPFLPCLNIYSIDFLKNILVMQNHSNLTYSFKNCRNIWFD
jgi:ADP-heptose:LPS heptosyltransferase